MKTESNSARSIAVEGTFFWLIASAIVTGFLAVSIGLVAGPVYFTLTLALAIIDLGLAFTCLKQKTLGFLASSVLALIVAGLAFEIVYSPIGALLLLLQLQIAFFAYRAYRDIVALPK